MKLVLTPADRPIVTARVLATLGDQAAFTVVGSGAEIVAALEVGVPWSTTADPCACTGVCGGHKYGR